MPTVDSPSGGLFREGTAENVERWKEGRDMWRPGTFQGSDKEPLDLSNPPTGGTAVTRPGIHNRDVSSDYTDFDGAQARVSNGVLCITWTAPNIGAANMTITPLSLIMWVGWTDEGDSCTVFYFGGHNLVVSCEKSRELTEFIRKHLEEAND